jgi:hypothetical protein
LWQPVFNVLRADPPGPLRTVLSTPLMASLAKDTYAVVDPGELTGLATGRQLSARLIDGYIDVVYRSTLKPGRVRAERGQLRPYEPADAARWLTSLAYLAYRDGTRDLRWWRLPWTDLTVRPWRGQRGLRR